MTGQCPTRVNAGVLVRSVLWHLMEEGTGTALQLAKLAGRSYNDLYKTLANLSEKKYIQRLESPPDAAAQPVRKGRVPTFYGLTKLGIEEALQVNRAAVLFSEEPATNQSQEALP